MECRASGERITGNADIMLPVIFGHFSILLYTGTLNLVEAARECLKLFLAVCLVLTSGSIISGCESLWHYQLQQTAMYNCQTFIACVRVGCKKISYIVVKPKSNESDCKESENNVDYFNSVYTNKWIPS